MWNCFMDNIFFRKRLPVVLFAVNLYQRHDKQDLWLGGYEANKFLIGGLINLGPPQMTSCCSFSYDNTFV